MSLKYSLNDIIAKAIMDKTPILIVEGKDDRQLYKKIASHINKTVEVYQVDEFDDFGPGCDNIINAITILQPKFEENTNNIKWVHGIIDKDVRPYRSTLPKGLLGISITKHYSIETYFATIDNIRKLLCKSTYASFEDIKQDVLNLIEDEISNNINDLYYISLEALKNACITDYDAIIGYADDETGNKVSALNSRKYILDQINPRKNDLDSFAKSKSISLDNIRDISKGKWYLFFYIYNAANIFKELKTKCRSAGITQCASCLVANHNNCLYNTRRNLDINNLYHDIFEYIDENELSDIISIINNMN